MGEWWPVSAIGDLSRLKRRFRPNSIFNFVFAVKIVHIFKLIYVSDRGNSTTTSLPEESSLAHNSCTNLKFSSTSACWLASAWAIQHVFEIFEHCIFGHAWVLTSPLTYKIIT